MSSNGNPQKNRPSDIHRASYKTGRILNPQSIERAAFKTRKTRDPGGWKECRKNKPILIGCRRYRTSDFEWLSKLTKEAFPANELFSEQRMYQRLLHPSSRSFVIEAERADADAGAFSHGPHFEGVSSRLASATVIHGGRMNEATALESGPAAGGPETAEAGAAGNQVLLEIDGDASPIFGDDRSAAKRVGVCIGWQFPKFLFGEYLAIDPAMRNYGVGRHFLRWLMRNVEGGSLIFECERPDHSRMAGRRYDFYRRIGFFPYPVDYQLPAMCPKSGPIAMCLMGGGKRLPHVMLKDVVKSIYTTIYQYAMDYPANAALMEKIS